MPVRTISKLEELRGHKVAVVVSHNLFFCLVYSAATRALTENLLFTFAEENL